MVQPPASLVANYELRETGTIMKRDSVLGMTPATVYDIKVEPILDLSLIDQRHFKEGFRADAAADWARTITERKRQNKKLAMAMRDNNILRYAKVIADSTFDEFREYYQKMAQFVVDRGDWSTQRFLAYVIDHRDSRLAGTPWSAFYTHGNDGPELTKKGMEAYFYFRKGVRSLMQYMLQDSFYTRLETESIHPSATYPAIRSRPGDVIGEAHGIVESNTLRISKHRDRNAAGIWISSQASWPIWDHDTKRQYYKEIYTHARKTFGHGAPYDTPEERGVEFYLDLEGDPDWIFYDTSNAEKLEGWVCPLPNRVCLSEEAYPLEVGFTKMSGGGNDTRTGGFWAECPLRLSTVELGYADVDKRLKGGGDNFGTKKFIKLDDPTVELVYARSDRLLGHDQYGPLGLKLVRDGAHLHESMRRRYTGYTARNLSIPAVSLAMAVLGLGLTSHSYWDFFRLMNWELDFFEAGGPHSYLMHTLDKYNRADDVIPSAAISFLAGVIIEILPSIKEKYRSLIDFRTLRSETGGTKYINKIEGIR